MRVRRRVALTATVLLTMVAALVVPLAGFADALPGPSVTSVTVVGTTVTATMAPAAFAEFFVDTIGVGGAGTPMTFDPDRSTLFSETATGELPPGLGLGSHTVFVHAKGDLWGDNFASASFSLGSASIPTQLGQVTIALTATRTYGITFHPGDPIRPTDPFLVFGAGFGVPSLAGFGVARASVAVAAGTINIDTAIVPGVVFHPGDPIRPGDITRVRLALVTLAATDGHTYRARTNGLTVTLTG